MNEQIEKRLSDILNENALNAGIKTNQDIVSKDSIITPNILLEALDKIPQTDNCQKIIVINPKDFSTLRKWDRDTLDIMNSDFNKKQDVIYYFGGARIVVNDSVPVGKVFATSDKTIQKIILKGEL